MSKELDALERIANAYISKYRYVAQDDDFEIIETALKRLEELEIENSEQFKEKWVQDYLSMTFELNVANKKLKALEIIKEKMVNVLELSICANYETYMSFFKLWNWNGEYDHFILTQEEYDLLHEVLL